MEYRLYNKLNCNLFDLIGDKEPDQTKGLGLLLAESRIAMQCFLELVGETKTEIKSLLKKRWVVDCELRQSLTSNKSLRADIVIRFYDGFNPYKVYIIEAKSVNAKIDLDRVAFQIANYKEKFDILSRFQEEQVVLVTLTNTSSLNQNIRTVTWQDLRNKFSQITESSKNKGYEIKIIKDYIHYINKIQGAMNFYDIEILSIPAGRSIDYIKNYFFYECPITHSYGKKHPLYVAFREGKNHGRIERLYKIKNIYTLSFNDVDAIRSLGSMENDPNIVEYIEAYKKDFKPGDGEKWFFLLDKDESIELPYPVEYRDSIRGMAGSVFLTLQEIFKKPEDRNGEEVVLIDKKN